MERKTRQTPTRALAKYRSMRNFKVTAEPSGGSARKASPKASKAPLPRFVIQEHHASHLHYDFRLESEGVLKSWAIPKIPVADPAVKRLAIQVEDHPLDYAGFEGNIPNGEYGAGHVKIWDRGEYAVTERSDRRIELILRGERLQGRFKLLRTSPNAGEKAKWLFMYVGAADSARSSAPADPLFLKVEGRVLKLHRLAKVLFPQSGFTKKNCLNYYRKISSIFLPQIAPFPISLKRFPDGTAAESFFEKHAAANRPDFVGKTEVGTAHPYVFKNLASILWAVNLAALEFHPYLSPIEAPDEAARLVIDLDPGEGADILDCAWVALETEKLLKRGKLRSFIKTSGSKGLHLIVPLNSGTTFHESRAFSRALAETLAKKHPDRIVSEQKKELRRGKVLVDWSQNDPKKTTAAVYSLRGIDPPQVSCPLSWAEVKTALQRKDRDFFRISPAQAVARVEKRGDLFAPVLALKQSLPRM